MTLQVSWLLLVAFSGVSESQSGWYVTHSRALICALKGSTVTLGCSYSYPYPISHVFWSHETLDPRYHYLGDTGYDCSLELRDVTEQNMGEYAFIIVPAHGPMVYEGGVRLSVTDIWVEAPGSVIEGSPVTLTCRTSCAVGQALVKFTWYRDGDFLPTYTTSTNELHLASVTKEDGGGYSCGVQTYNRRSATVALSVRYPPRWVSASASPSGCVTEGGSVTFACASDADPPVEDYTWYKDDVAQGGWGRTHTIHRVGVRDRGEYRCQGRNQYGEKMSGAVTLNVLPQRNNVSVSVHPPGDVVEGAPVTLTCSGGADPSTTAYAWYKGPIWLAGGRTYAIHQIGPGDAGDYKCQGKDGGGDQFSITIHLDVQYPPRSVVALVDPSCSIIKGTPLILSCSSDANPPAPAQNHTWYKAGVLVARRRTLRLAALGPGDAGEYSCRSENAHGAKLSEPVSIHLSYPPENVAVSASPSREVKEGDPVMLTCSADAGPPVREYIWFKGRAKIRAGRTYSINRSSTWDAGKYKCQASNEHGNRYSAILRLNVLYPPKSVRVTVSAPGGVVVGESVTLTCSADANPPPEDYEWYKGSALTGTGSTYSIRNLSREDGGEYECKFRNQQGEGSGHVTLTVSYPPRSVSVQVSPAGGVTEGEAVTLTCSADAHPPVENYTWHTDGGDTPFWTGQSLSLILGPGTCGRYVCRAWNTYGAGTSAAVEVSPNGVSSLGNTVYIVVGILGAGVAAVVAVLCCMRGRRPKWNRHEYENDEHQAGGRGHTPLGDTPNTGHGHSPARPGYPEGMYTALDPRTIGPDYATLVTGKNRPFKTKTSNQ